ncbi:M48 family metallopeptidase [bacterium]|nr:M48 family metallopeptidase [Blautia producta]MCI6042530.1 M48 family metallopeptidase [bacterium]MDY3022079.1 M48 family metallopeptidase [Oliverpabstia sp.]
MALDYKLYLHDSDKAAMAALKAIPGFSQVMKAFMKIWSEQQLRLINMSTNLRLNEKQMAKYYNMLPPICTKLGIDVPELFVELDVHPNAYTYGDTKPFIVITSGLFETLPDELIPTVLAHECGHIACHHTLYTTMGRAILNGASAFVSGLGNIALYPIQLAFAYWMRCSEFSADRAAIICDGSAEKSTEVMMRFAGYDKDIMADANVEAFMEQALEYKNLVDNNAWNKTLEFILFQNYDHPLNAIRAYEGREWEKTELYKNILEYVNSETSDDESKLPVEVSIKKMIGKNVVDVQAKLLTMGFDNIKTVRNTEATKTKEGSIIAITINELSEDGWYKRSDEVRIEYFEAKTDEEIALEHPGEIKIGENQKYFLGKNYEEVKVELKYLGFTNFTIKEMAMSKIGWGEKENCVAKIIINDQSQFDKDSWFIKESEVIIYYYVRVK